MKERSFRAIIAAGGVAMFMFVVYANMKERTGEFYLSMAKIITIAIALVGIYVIVRALLILMAKTYLPSIPLFGNKTARAVQLVGIGVLIGIFAPWWAVIIWVVGAICGFLTNGFY